MSITKIRSRDKIAKALREHTQKFIGKPDTEENRAALTQIIQDKLEAIGEGDLAFSLICDPTYNAITLKFDPNQVKFIEEEGEMDA